VQRKEIRHLNADVRNLVSLLGLSFMADISALVVFVGGEFVIIFGNTALSLDCSVSYIGGVSQCTSNIADQLHSVPNTRRV
jgi:hypothetical protein